MVAVAIILDVAFHSSSDVVVNASDGVEGRSASECIAIKRDRWVLHNDIRSAAFQLNFCALH